MSAITVDELPDFVQKEYPDMGLNCVADIANESIVIQKEGRLVASFTEKAFEDNSVTEELVRERIAKFRERQN